MIGIKLLQLSNNFQNIFNKATQQNNFKRH